MVLAFLLSRSIPKSIKTPLIIPIDSTETKIGRKSDVRIDTERGKEISKHHCTLYFKRNSIREFWIIEDNKSLNGTFINGKKIRKSVINSGDEIVLGGGSCFHNGDVIDSTTEAPCRYLFYVPPLPIIFEKNANPNESILPAENYDLCTICYSPSIISEELPCGHLFCSSCIHKWAEMCSNTMRPCLCPLCRTPFSISCLIPEEYEIKNNQLRVYNVKPLLIDLCIPNCRIIKKLNVFRVWDKKKEKIFWSSINLIKDDYTKMCIFLHLTKISIFKLFAATKEELMNAISNLTKETIHGDKTFLLNRLLIILNEKCPVGMYKNKCF